ncbi:MAG TPA: DUF2000 domain-containing protein [Selenomonadales bacterium]|nr:DUF2000 domain-containing protein [Selenomonadales bacterium]
MKTVLIIDRALPLGLIANTAAVLGISLGAAAPEIVGQDVPDADGHRHRGITNKTIPILGGTGEQLRLLRDRLFAAEFAEVGVVDFSDIAQSSLDYGYYAGTLASTPGDRLSYLGLCLYGPDKLINKLTGSMGLLR